MDREHFLALLGRHPVVVTENYPALGTIPGLDVVTDLKTFQASLDMGSLDPTRRYALLRGTPELMARFPTVNPSFDAFGPGLNEALFERPELFVKLMSHQEMLGNEVVASAQSDFEVIILVVVDGLSYRDCRQYEGVKPCFVNGVTKTREGYRRVIGDPTIGRRLAKYGYMNRLGFTYWSRQDDPLITDEIFVPFLDSQMHKVSDFEAVLNCLQIHPLRRTYVQLVLQGLDYLSHGASDEPLIDAHVGRLFERLNQIADLLRKRDRKAVIFMTADHGILWKNQHLLEKVDEPAWNVGHGIRYLNGKIARSYLRHDSYDGRHYSLLKYPLLFRKLGPTEWGVHGGVSYEESIVPFYRAEV